MKHSQRAITFVEVICAITIFGLSLPVIWQALLFSYAGAKAGSYRIEAIARCQERMEDIKNAAYANINSTSFPSGTVTLDTLGTATTSDDILASRTTTIQDMTTFKQITITTSWTFRQKTYSESAKTIVSP